MGPGGGLERAPSDSLVAGNVPERPSRRRSRTLWVLATAMLVGAALSGCGSSVGSKSAPVDPMSLTWTKQSPTTSPGATRPVATYDPGLGKVVLFGGFGNPPVAPTPQPTTGNFPPQYRNDTWTYDGTTWTKESPATSPPAAEVATMAYDGAIQKVVLFEVPMGAATGETWTYDGATWTKESPATSPELSSNRPVMAYDAAIGKLVLLSVATWTYDGQTWTKTTAPNLLSAYEYGPLTYDATLKKLVLYDMSTTGDATTWTYDGQTWTGQPAGVSPARIFGWSMAYDAALGRTVLFGGVQYDATERDQSGSASFNDTWTFDGHTWTQQHPTTSPTLSAQAAALMVYDDAHNRLVLYSAEGAQDETWTYGPPSGK